MATKPKSLRKSRTAGKASSNVVREPSQTARTRVAGKIRLPGVPEEGTAAGYCFTNCASNCGSNCASDCGSNCASDCGSNCASDCGSNCSSDCDCGSNRGRLREINEHLDRLESYMHTRFGDMEKVLERISLNTRKRAPKGKHHR